MKLDHSYKDISRDSHSKYRNGLENMKESYYVKKNFLTKLKQLGALLIKLKFLLRINIGNMHNR